MKSSATVHTCLGEITIIESEGDIVTVSLGNKNPSKDAVAQESPVLKNAAQQINEYLAGDRKEFSLRLNPDGSAFQKKVWAALMTIPYGETVSYKEIAERIGQPGAARAVGMANNKNPILIAIPCHRVVGASGSLVGYAAGLDVKEKLLALEKAQIDCKNKPGL